MSWVGSETYFWKSIFLKSIYASHIMPYIATYYATYYALVHIFSDIKFGKIMLVIVLWKKSQNGLEKGQHSGGEG